jgi:acyl-CoA reductase-like NAD-dependent aldehyde dehydrogenase
VRKDIMPFRILLFDSFNEAIGFANRSKYGLGAVLRTSDPLLARKG